MFRQFAEAASNLVSRRILRGVSPSSEEASSHNKQENTKPTPAMTTRRRLSSSSASSSSSVAGEARFLPRPRIGGNNPHEAFSRLCADARTSVLSRSHFSTEYMVVWGNGRRQSTRPQTRVNWWQFALSAHHPTPEEMQEKLPSRRPSEMSGLF